MQNFNSPVSLYFHIPFCTKKCDYCHFYVLPNKDPLKAMLMDGLQLEWRKYAPMLKDKEIVSIYFGGGTPYLLGPKPMKQILRRVYDSVNVSGNAEITLEANPEDITLETMQAYKEIGINRASIGLQTLENRLLKTLGRLHSAEKGLESIHITKKAGISNISLDLMYDLPNQSLEIWNSTVEQIRELPITHLSLYNLTIEPHTVFFKYRDKLQRDLPDPETSAAMYELGIKGIESMGLKQYEISAFAKDGFYSRHNTGYWTGRPFIGFGPSAFSYWEGRRFRNIANLSKYSKMLEEGLYPIDFEEHLDEKAQKRELLVIGIRMLEGVDLESFGKLDEETEKTVGELIGHGLLKIEGKRMKLTQRGILFYDTVATDLV